MNPTKGKASASDSNAMISDGNGPRLLWTEGDGDGDSDLKLIRSGLRRISGHSTWKIFADKVPDPITRYASEPPHYVYLDDRACHAIYTSEHYNDVELQTFWPYDFSKGFKIKANRAHRGNPAYVDDSCSEYATGDLWGKQGKYQFSGSSDHREHRAIMLQGTEQASQKSIVERQNSTPKRTLSLAFPEEIQQVSGSSAKKLRSNLHTQQFPSKIPPPLSSKSPRPQSPNSSEPLIQIEVPSSFPVKKEEIASDNVSGVGRNQLTGSKPETRNYSHSGIAQLKARLERANEAIADLKNENTHLKENFTFHGLCVVMIETHETMRARVSSYEAGLQRRERAILKFQKELPGLLLDTQEQLNSIQPLTSGLRTVLDEPGQYMYEHGMDEEFDRMVEKARRDNRTKGAPSRAHSRPWNFS